jgi:high-affinity iron transporter
MIDAVVIVLREVLEAMMVCCVLLASSYALGARRIWLLPVTLVAVGGALLYASNLATLTALFDGRGQELTNVLLLVLTGASLLFYLLQLPAVLHNKRTLGKKEAPVTSILYAALIIASAAAMIRELAEIFIYVFSYGIASGQTVPVVSGAVIGAGVGVSLGIFIFFGLLWLGKRRCLQMSALLLGLISAGMLSQATRFLVQSGFLPGEHILWDSGWLISESSLPGELLHALLGYDATPGIEQLTVYVVSLAFAMLLLRKLMARQGTDGDALRQ